MLPIFKISLSSHQANLNYLSSFCKQGWIELLIRLGFNFVFKIFRSIVDNENFSGASVPVPQAE
jgi:hypothetical protein